MFKFHFLPDENDNENEVSAVRQPEEVEQPSCSFLDTATNTSLRQSRMHLVDADLYLDEEDQVPVELFLLSEGMSLLKRVGVVNMNANADTSQNNAPTDLVPGEYEGGFKVWECSIDLSRYIAKEGVLAPGMRVMELGCGQGLPGITGIVSGAEVHFQDYDWDVVDQLTIPVVMKNVVRVKEDRDGCSCQPRFFSGDWGTLPSVLEEHNLLGTYDVVLTTETIYSLDSIPRLLACIKQCLKKPSGVCYLSAKSFYFGVGGGIAAFLQEVNRDGSFIYEQVLVIDDGKSNRREIFALRFATE